MTQEKPKQTTQLLLENCRVVATFDDDQRDLSNVDILIEDNLVKAIGENLRVSEKLEEDIPFIPCQDMLVLPGFVNVHHHMFQVLTRVTPRVQNAELFDWLVENYKIWENLDPESIHLAAIVSIAELLLSGTTTTSDHHYLFPVNQSVELIDQEFRAGQELGMRMHPTRGSMTLGVDDDGLPPMTLVESVDRVLEDYDRVLAKYHDTKPNAMTRVALAPCAPFNAKESLFRDTVTIAREKGALIHTHLAETDDEDVYCQEQFGCRPFDYVAGLGWEGPDVWFAHCVKLNDDEIKRFAESGTGVAHCPSANARLGSGVAPVHKMLEAGVRVGLGVDGSSSNDSGSMLDEIRNAFMLHRATWGVDALDGRQALRMATNGGAKILCRENEIGKIQVGCCADITMIDIDRLDFAGGGSLDPISSLVFCGLKRPVDYTIVNGSIVVERGQISKFTEKQIVREANRVTAALIEKASQKHKINFLIRENWKK